MAKVILPEALAVSPQANTPLTDVSWVPSVLI
jgi:hypothetical protein